MHNKIPDFCITEEGEQNSGHQSNAIDGIDFTNPVLKKKKSEKVFSKPYRSKL